MLTWSTIFLHVLVNLEISQSVSKYRGFNWSYLDQSKWPGELCKEGGYHQSPIDIQPETALKDYKQLFIKYGALEFNDYTTTVLNGVNNGHTIQLSTVGEESALPSVVGGPLSRAYRLEQLHFHWLSEHAIGGKKFPVEIHFVHIRSDLQVKQALQRKDGLAIVSVMCETTHDISEEDEQKVKQLMSYIPMLKNTGDKISGIMIDLSKLLPDTNSYYTYFGSLTSPQCNEVVTWIIFDKPLTITDKQYKQLTSVGFGKQNYRSLQPLKSHIVYTPAPDSIFSTPYVVGLFKNMYQSMANFFSDLYSDTEDKSTNS